MNSPHEAFLRQHHAEFTALRQHIHQNPELGFEEEQTSQLVADLLTEWGYDVHRGFAKTGVVGTLKIGTSNKTIGLRADLDALPIVEDTGKAWQSKIQGKFHGCGHDGHTVSLLAAAKALAHSQNFDGTVHLIFQPAEELLYGGKVMLNDGLFTQFPCDRIFGLHNLPSLPAGEFYFREGAFLASSDTLHIHVRGKGGHGALPEHTIDATFIACHIVVALQSIVSRNIGALQQGVVTVGSIQSGDVANVINDYALLKLSVRALSQDVRNVLLQRIQDIVEFQAKSFGATAEIENINSCPVLINDTDATQFATQVAQQIFGQARVHLNAPPLMGSEDFAFMLEANPNGCYCFIGNGEGHMLHHPKYDFNDEIIIPAASYWCGLVEHYLAK